MKNNHIDYIEFKSHNLEVTKKFYGEVFDWKFTDYGPEYISFISSWINGGFELSTEKIMNGVLVVLSHNNLELVQEKIVQAWWKIIVETFEFPGGKRFQFQDPSGNELAVWTEL